MAGIHFYHAPYVFRWAEVVKGERTSDATFERADLTDDDKAAVLGANAARLSDWIHSHAHQGRPAGSPVRRGK